MRAITASKQVLTDALTVYSVYSQLERNLEQEQLNKLMDAFGSTKDVSGASNSKTLESDVDALRVTVSKFQTKDKESVNDAH